ncbi:ATP-dependent RNA helicase DDX51 isoform X2 [Lacerta agilis]|uniref:ATP-dependent RNA helicase DDX51 isoform X2 n=1 Tax=Lacerta agilis TaxID=80427 RepID=UPI0014197060|nr:ATP-dependent RNA helicase DDX51 isoform X2 [Lacerta agilis]
MALFVVHRYLGDEDNDPEDHSQVLLRRLKERVRARQQQKQQQQQQDDHMPAESGPNNEMPDLDLEKEAKQKSKKRKQSEESPFTEGHRKRKKKLSTEGGEGVEEKDCDLSPRRSKTSGKESKTPQGSTDGGEGSEIKLASHLENDGSAGEGEDGSEARANESQGEEEQTLKSPRDPKETPPPPNTIVLGDWGWKAAQKKKVEPHLPRWLAEPKLVQRRIKENVVPLQDVPVIHPKLRKKLQANGIESLFPVQAEVIPAILESGFLAGRGGYQPSDICVSAPTGSGKTLAFVIPVVQALLDRVVCRVRALAVLPTKELAQQVNKVFNIYTDGTGLKVVQLTGQKSFAKEQESLAEETLMGFRSLADIVVATPGRLVDHLQQSPQFSLKELRFLIIDEADRMIDNMHQDWLRQVVAAAHSAAEEGSGTLQLFRRAEQGPLTAARAGCPHVPLQKLLFSATLTRNPEKLQPLGLYRPRLFTPISLEKATETTKKYALPEGLSQYYVPCSLRWKPLFLLHFLLRLKFSRVLCFTNSRDTSHRLFLLLRSFGGVNVAEFSSRLNPRQRKLTLKEFEQGKIQLLISTDATARGIDIGGVKCVISYDAPQFIRTYIHRVGRTARAGKAGLAFTMVLKQQERKFLKMLREAGLPELEQQLVKNTSLQPLLPQYEEALADLQKIMKEERAEKRS